MSGNRKKSKGNISRIMHYFWMALMRHKIRTILIVILVPVWIFVSNVVVPLGMSEIVGKLSAGDFEFSNYVGLLLITLIPSGINTLFVIRAIDWLDWSLDAKCGEYLSQLAFAAVINQSMTFHNNKFSGSLTSAANKLPNAFINLKSGFVWDIYPLLLTIVFSVVATGIVCLPFALILVAYSVVYLTIAIATYYRTKYVEENLAETENKRTGQLAD